MGALTVRRVDDELIRRLKIRAARKGVSAEAEHRAILEAVLGRPAPDDTLVEFFQRSPLRATDLEGVEERAVSNPLDIA